MFHKDVVVKSNTLGGSTSNANFYYGKVIDVDDPSASKRIRVKILGIDDKTEDKDLPWCLSFLPINICIPPKTGEMVKILFQSKEDIHNKREWIGPVISNFSKLEYESYANALNNSQLSNKELPKKNNDKVFNTDDLTLNGRNNTDILFRKNELVFRAGKSNSDNINELNERNMSTFRLKLSADGNRSDATILSDHILLISSEGRFNFNKVISDNEVKNIIDNAYSATYAEPLIEYLELLKDFAVNHVHTTRLPANTGVGSVVQIGDFDLDRIRAKNIKIN